MQFLRVLVSVLLAWPCLCTEKSSMNIEQLKLQAVEYEANIQQDLNKLDLMKNDDFIADMESEIDLSTYIDEFETMRNKLKQFNEQQKASSYCRTQLLSIEPTLCLPEHNINGAHQLILPSRHLNVSCYGDDSAGPGWILIQRRINENWSFRNSMHEYTQGFGNSAANYFIGLENLYRLTNLKPHELYIRLESWNGTRFARYSHFQIDGKYKLISLGDFEGDAGNALESAMCQPFISYDTPKYNVNDQSYLNTGWRIGKSNAGPTSNFNALSSNWLTWHDSFKSVQMMIRPLKCDKLITPVDNQCTFIGKFKKLFFNKNLFCTY